MERTVLLTRCGNVSHPQKLAENIAFLQALVCLFLFTLANVIKAFIAKLIATHFHKEQYFDRMQAALRKVKSLVLPTLPVFTCSCKLVWQGDSMSTVSMLKQPAAECEMMNAMWHKVCAPLLRCTSVELLCDMGVA